MTHGNVHTSTVGRSRMIFGKRVFTHRCPICSATKNLALVNAVCTGKRIRKEKRGPDGRSLDFQGLKPKEPT